MSEEMKICGFWRNKKTGELKSSLGDFKLVIKSNVKKMNSTQPDMIMYIAKSARDDKKYNSAAIRKQKKATGHDDYLGLTSGLRIKDPTDEIPF